MILWILAISSGKSWIVFPGTGRISTRRSGLGCLIVGMAWCQMFSDVYNVSPLSEVIGRFVLPQTAACRFSKDEIRVSNPDSIHGNCSGRFRFPGILAALRIGPKEMPTVGVPHHTTLMLISHVGWANWWSLFIVCHSQRASSTSGRSRRSGLRWVSKQQMMQEVPCYHFIQIRMWWSGGSPGERRFRTTNGPVDHKIQQVCARRQQFEAKFGLCDRCGPIILFLSGVHKDMIRFKLNHSVFSTE